MADLRYSQRATEQLQDLEYELRERILSKLESVVDWPDHYLEPLSNYPYHRLRVGDYRVIVNWDRDDEVIEVLAVGHRRNVYDREL